MGRKSQELPQNHRKTNLRVTRSKFRKGKQDLPLEDAIKVEEKRQPSENQVEQPNQQILSEKAPDIKHALLLRTDFAEMITLADFNIFCYEVERSKVYGISLLDQLGRIVFASKLGNQFFEGCLNNLEKVKFLDMVYIGSRKRLEQSFEEPVCCRVIRYLIYSKNAKRRYSKSEPFIKSEEYLFFKYMKYLVSRIRPVYLNISDYQKLPGFWNSALIEEDQKKTEGKGKIYYLFETKLSEEFPSLKSLSLLNDPRIKRFEELERRKKVRRQAWEQSEAHLLKSQFEERHGAQLQIPELKNREPMIKEQPDQNCQMK